MAQWRMRQLCWGTQEVHNDNERWAQVLVLPAGPELTCRVVVTFRRWAESTWSALELEETARKYKTFQRLQTLYMWNVCRNIQKTLLMETFTSSQLYSCSAAKVWRHGGKRESQRYSPVNRFLTISNMNVISRYWLCTDEGLVIRFQSLKMVPDISSVERSWIHRINRFLSLYWERECVQPHLCLIKKSAH